MHGINDFLVKLDGYLGGHPWFMVLLIGTGLFFTIYLGFPQIRYFRHAIRITRGTYDHSHDIGDTSHFQSLATALSGTVGTGNIAGVALAIHLGGPAALFWMLVTAAIGMCTKMVEVSISHKYRDILPDGSVSGGPMYYMKKRLNIKTGSGKIIKTGVVLGAFFAGATILSSFGTGSLPQINSISNSVFASFGIKHIITGGILAVLLGLVIHRRDKENCQSHFRTGAVHGISISPVRCLSSFRIGKHNTILHLHICRCLHAFGRCRRVLGASLPLP
jgi:AGCS family alanine or glycine:cation symporter